MGVAGLALANGDTSGRDLYGTECDNLIGGQIVTAEGERLELGPDKNEVLSQLAFRAGTAVRMVIRPPN